MRANLSKRRNIWSTNNFAFLQAHADGYIAVNCSSEDDGGQGDDDDDDGGDDSDDNNPYAAEGCGGSEFSPALQMSHHSPLCIVFIKMMMATMMGMTKVKMVAGSFYFLSSFSCLLCRPPSLTNNINSTL